MGKTKACWINGSLISVSFYNIAEYYTSSTMAVGKIVNKLGRISRISGNQRWKKKLSWRTNIYFFNSYS